MDEKTTLEVKTPMGTLVAYASTDPQNPGIFIDLKKDGVDFQLNLAGVECQIPEDDDEAPKMVSHIWGNGVQEDTTHDVEHTHIDAYFNGE